MPQNQGKFVWYELMTSDDKAAASFYADVVGWEAKDSGLPGPPYTILSAGPQMIAGLMPTPAHAEGVPPNWMGYIGVDNVDACTEKVKAAGGSICRPPADIPTIGRFAVAADPHGTMFALFTGTGTPPPEDRNAPGHIGWHELHSGDLDTAWAFYSGLFGWSKTESIDMGAMGVYQMFSTGGPTIGGMMTKMPDVPKPFWLYYFNVDAIDAAVERINKASGKVFMGPHEVPGGQWIVQGFDPQGAMFALVVPPR